MRVSIRWAHRQIDQCDYTRWTRSHVCTHKYSLLCSLYSGVCSSPRAWLRVFSCLQRGCALHCWTLLKQLLASRRSWWTELKETPMCQSWASCTTQAQQNHVEQEASSSLCFLNENLTRRKTSQWNRILRHSTKQQDLNNKNLYVE